MSHLPNRGVVMALSLVILSILLAISLTVTALLLKDLKTSSVSSFSHQAFFLAQSAMDCALYLEANVTTINGVGVFPTSTPWYPDSYQYLSGYSPESNNDPVNPVTTYIPVYESFNMTKTECLGLQFFPEEEMNTGSEIGTFDHVSFVQLDGNNVEIPTGYDDGVRFQVTIDGTSDVGNGCVTLTQYAAPSQPKLFVSSAKVPCVATSPVDGGQSEGVVERVLVVKVQ